MTNKDENKFMHKGKLYISRASRGCSGCAFTKYELLQLLRYVADKSKSPSQEQEAV